MQGLKIFGLLALAMALVIIGMIVYGLAPRMSASVPSPMITNFDECVAAGNPVMESYPEQCRTADGRLFVNANQSETFPAQGEGMVVNGCAVAGCSQQLCVSADEAANMVTTCEYRAEYACYREASCEPQSDGKCGWTETAELKQCLANPPMIEGGLEVM